MFSTDGTVTDESPIEAQSPSPWPEALEIGATYDGTVSTTVTEVLRGQDDDTWAPAGEGYEWLTVGVRTCVPAGASTSQVGWYQWAATGVDGGWYAADLDYGRPFPRGQYPRLAEVVPGECVEGRVLIPVPQQAEVIALINADKFGAPQGSWLVGDIGVPATADGE